MYSFHDPVLTLAKPARQPAPPVRPDLRASTGDAPPPIAQGPGPIVLPGGAVTLRKADGTLMVADAAQTLALGGPEARRLRRALREAPGEDVLTLHHHEGDLRVRAGVPDGAGQCRTLLTAGAALRAGLQAAPPMGRLLIEWRDDAALIWPLIPASEDVLLAADVTSGMEWRAEGRRGIAELIAPGLSGRAASGSADLAERLAEALHALPAPFTAEGEDAGAATMAAWPNAAAALRRRPGLAMLTLRRSGGDVAMAAHEILHDEGLLVLEDGGEGLDHPAVLGSPTALRALSGRTALRCALLTPMPDQPSELLVLARRLSRATGSEVMAAAPGWGLYHRLDAIGGEETGNAGWFGAAAGLDRIGTIPTHGA